MSNMQYDFSTNPNPAIQIIEIGNERQPVVVIDGMMRNPKSVVDFAAAEVQFAPPRMHYPGLQAPIPQAYVGNIYNAILPLIRDVFHINVNPLKAGCFFALATTPRDQLTVQQRLPHVDTAKPNDLAILHYLCDSSHGGTGMYRHRATGYETLDFEKAERHLQMVLKDLEENGPLPAEYVTGSNRIYEQFADFEAKFDRVLIYRSRVLHSASIRPTATLSPDPRLGRLTVNTFLTYP